MKFIFKAVTLAVLAGALAACFGPGSPHPTAGDGGDAQRLVTLVDYVGGDYGRAVSGGEVVSPAEYDEQLRFVADARRLAGRLVGGAVAGDSLQDGLASIESLVREKADPEAVTAACLQAKTLAVARFGLSTMPPGRPSLHRARALYSANCAICHGGKGDGDTPRARELEPRPASFRETARLAQLSPYRVYNTLTFGVPGTAMASFETLSTAERWDLAFYVFRLGHEGAAGRGPVDLTLAELASSSDAELLRLLRSGGADAEGALTFARHDAAFSEPQVGAGVGRARRLVREAASAFSAGRPDAADRHLIDAYLQGFEPEEPRLRSRDPEGTLAVEAAFRDLRAAMARDDRATALGLAWALERRLATLSEGGARVVVPFTAAFLIFFREGLEAALVVAALLAVVRKLGRSDAARYVHVGWIAALPAGLLTFWAFERFLALSAVRRELLEALVALTAAGVLFSVSFWMISKAESRHWLAYLRQNVERSLGGRRLFVLAGLAFLAVYREAAETVLFTHALLLDATAARSEVAAGAAAGVTAVALLALALNRSVLRLSLGPFFAVSGVLLCGLAMSFAGSGMYTLVAAGYLSPRPVSFPEIPWMGIHPDLSGLVVQLSIAVAIAAAGIATLRRTPDPRL